MSRKKLSRPVIALLSGAIYLPGIGLALLAISFKPFSFPWFFWFLSGSLCISIGATFGSRALLLASKTTKND